MATATFLDATLAADGESLTVRWKLAIGNSWTSPTVDTTLRLYMTISSQDVEYVSAGSPTVSTTDNANDTVAVVFTMRGHGFSSETVTVTADASLITDAEDGTAALSGSSVTNNSTATIGSRHTRWKARPVAVWAYRDEFPLGYDVDNETSTNAGTIALAAVDNWTGIDYVEFVLDWNASINTDATVTISETWTGTQMTVKVAANRYTDIFGHGFSADYWYFELDLTSITDGTQGDVTEVNITDLEGTTHSMIADSKLDARTVVARKSPTIKYLNSDLATGLNDGSSRANAWQSVTTAETNAGTTTDIIYVEGDDSATNIDFNQSRSSRYLRWVADPQAAAVATWTFTGTCNYRDFQSFEGVNLAVVGSGGAKLRLTAIHTNIEFASMDFSGTSDTNRDIDINAGQHISIVGCTVTWMSSGITAGPTSGTRSHNNIIHGLTCTLGGTIWRGSLRGMLIERVTQDESVKSAQGFTALSHADGYHGFGKIAHTGFNYTHSTTTLDLTSGTAKIPAFDSNDDILITGGTGLTDNTITPAPTGFDANSITLSGAPDGATGDITDNSVTFNYYADEYQSGIVRYTRNIRGGDTTLPTTANMALMQAHGHDVCFYNNISFNWQSSQQIFQIEGRQANFQIVHNTILAIDNDAESDARGISFSGGLASDPYTNDGYLVRNNIVHTMVQSLGGHPSGQSPISSVGVRNTLLGPNLYSDQGAGSLLTRDSSTNTGTAGLASYALTDTSTAPFDFMPTSSSAALDLAAASDVKWDYNGVNSRDDVGAVEFVASAASSGTSRRGGVGRLGGLGRML